MSLPQKTGGKRRFTWRPWKRGNTNSQNSLSVDEKRKKLEQEKEDYERLAPPSRYTDLPAESANTILKEIKNFLETRVTDKYFLFEREKLKRKHPHNSEDSIDWMLFSCFNNKVTFKGRESDLKEKIVKLNGSSMIKSTQVSSSISIGIQKINSYIKNGGSLHCILCGKAALRDNVVCRESTKDVPIFVINGLNEYLLRYTGLKVEKDCEVMAFKKVKDNPFGDLLKSIAEKIPDDIPISVSTWTADGLTQIPWKESLDRYDDTENGHSRNGESTEKSKGIDHLSEASVESESKFTASLGQLKMEDQKMILGKLDTDFQYTFPRYQVVQRRIYLEQQKNPKLEEVEIEKQLYLYLLCNEFCAGLDIVDIMFTMGGIKARHNHVVASVPQMYKHAERGGLFHFILYCSSAAESVNKDGEFKKIATKTRMLEVEGLSSIIFKYFGTSDDLAILAFKKAEDNPYKEMIEFVEDKMPEYVPKVEALEEEEPLGNDNSNGNKEPLGDDNSNGNKEPLENNSTIGGEESEIIIAEDY